MRGWAIAAAVVLTMVFGLLFLQGPTPVIIVAPETVFHWGGLAVTNTMFTSWIVVLLLCLVAVFAGPRMQLVPTGFSGFIEAIVSGFYGLVESAVGEVRAREFFWVVATIFFYVITSNYVGLLPFNFTFGLPEAGHGETQVEFRQTSIAGIDLAYIPFNPKEIEVEAHAEGAAAEGATTEHASSEGAAAEGGELAVGGAKLAADGSFTGLLAPYFRSVNTDVNTPAAIAIYSFVFVEFWGLRALGLGYLKKFFNFGPIFRARSPGALFSGVIDAFVGLLELISELSRMVSFTFRLFGNIFAGEVLLAMMAFLVPLVLINLFFGLELLVGAVQAFVFAMLTLVFAQTAVASHGDDHEDGHAAVHE